MRACSRIATSLLMIVIGGCGAGKHISVSAVTPHDNVQVSSDLAAENQPSCKDRAWAFNPENDIPDFTDSCAWRPIEEGQPFPWIHRFAIEESGRSVEVQLGCRQTYIHRYANIVGEAFYVFCRQSMRPDLKEWSVPGDESPVGWVAFADESGNWIRLGWGARFKVSGQMELESRCLSWVNLTFRSNQGEVVSRVFEQKEE